MNEFTGPWIINAKLKGSSYEIKRVEDGAVSKRHAAHLSPYPDQLLPFLPVDGPDNQFDQIHTPIQKDPYVNAGLKGFKPAQPFEMPMANPALPADDVVHFPTLAELNAECFELDEGEEDLFSRDNLARICCAFWTISHSTFCP